MTKQAVNPRNKKNPHDRQANTHRCQRAASRMPLIEAEPNYIGEIGVISSVTQAFCSTCTRARLSTEGKLYTCLFAQSGHDLRVLMRSGKSDAQIAAAIGLVWSQRADRYSEIRTEETARMKKIEMSYSISISIGN